MHDYLNDPIYVLFGCFCIVIELHIQLPFFVADTLDAVDLELLLP